ncbi:MULTISPECIES: DoxX family protein [Achromobacter]|uniref:DoxX n=1 Tax=Achromobacter spanius TaxID=217203 RepID=A0AAW3I6Y6_9BURK|nr:MULTISPECIES: DoxX family protein [Achromobacter]KNE28646.1 DoxX [Achromobacter spanius]MCD0496683.1 DoxX family protein [Achromobacter sp. MY14]MCW3156344.1 DoxX family protein [Achromobacter spanius]
MDRPATAAPVPEHRCVWRRLNAQFERIPHWLIALLGRFSIAAVFWKSGQTKVEGFAVDLISGEFQLGWPSVSASAVSLFADEYRLPLAPPEWAALAAATAEHVLPVLLLLGLATRLSALGLLVMTAVIQIFVYPDAYPTHGVWAAVLLYLVARGGGAVSLDALIQNAKRR